MDSLHERPISEEWNALITGLPEPHLLQTKEWAQTKAYVGWKPHYLVWSEHQGQTYFHINQLPASHVIRAAAVVLQRSLPIGGFSALTRILYAPKGPLLDWDDVPLRDRVIGDLQRFAINQRAVFIKVDPDVRIDIGASDNDKRTEYKTAPLLQQSLLSNGWHYSPEQIQFRNTMLIDLTDSETQILERMKQKTRYNIRLAGRKGVTVRKGTPDDFPLLYHMYAETSLRDNFTIRNEGYYHNVWGAFSPPGDLISDQPHSQPLIAEVDGEPVAALILFIFARNVH